MAVISPIIKKKNTAEKGEKSFYPTRNKYYTEIAIKYLTKGHFKSICQNKGLKKFIWVGIDNLFMSSISVEI